MQCYYWQALEQHATASCRAESHKRQAPSQLLIGIACRAVLLSFKSGQPAVAEILRGLHDKAATNRSQTSSNVHVLSVELTIVTPSVIRSPHGRRTVLHFYLTKRQGEERIDRWVCWFPVLYNFLSGTRSLCRPAHAIIEIKHIIA